MSTGKLGLVFNLVGSILLGSYIVGKKRLDSLENKLKVLPKITFDRIFEFAIGITLRSTMKHFFLRELKTEERAYELIGFFKKKPKFKWPDDLSAIRKNPFIYRLFSSILLGIFLALSVCFALSPIILLLFIITKPFALVQEKARIETYFGLLGILFLIIGFILQMFSK